MGKEDIYDVPYYGPWEMTPRWHPARWFGFDIRRYQNHEPYDRGWDYGRSGQVARDVLSKAYEPNDDAPTRQSANYSGDMMTLEEKLRALAAKGELVHFSVACKDGIFWANYAPASTSGYARESDADPVTALERALASAPVKLRAPKARPEKSSDEGARHQEPEPAPEITATVTSADAPEKTIPAEIAASDEIVDTGFPNDWTNP